MVLTTARDRRHSFRWIAGICFLAACASAPAHAGGFSWADHAGEPRSQFSFAFGADAEFGGDDVATVAFVDGSHQNVRAGQGVSLSLGGYFRPAPESPFGVRATLGYKYVTTKASNADITLTRVVTELVGTYRFNDSFWMGAGPVRHSSIKFDGGGLGPDLRFDSATGFRAEAGWRWFALAFTGISYKDEFGNSYGANSIGVSFTNRF